MGGEGKGTYPLVSKGEGRATNRGAELGKQVWASREVYRQEGLEKAGWQHTLACVDAHMHTEFGFPFLHVPTKHQPPGPCNTVNTCPRGKCFLGLERIQKRRLSHPENFPPYTGLSAYVIGEQISISFSRDTVLCIDN